MDYSPWSRQESDTTEKQITSHNNIDETAALTHRAQSWVSIEGFTQG